MSRLQQVRTTECRDDVFLRAYPEISIALAPSTKTLGGFFSVGFWIIAQNKTVADEFMTRYVR